MLSAWTGFYVDMFDVYLPIVALGPALIYFQPAALSQEESRALFVATFVAALLGRPVGALIFGHLADTIGRRRLTLFSIAGFSVCTLLIGLLPGYATWGLAAPIALVLLRFIDGIFLGGEYTSATPLAFEHCPRPARGLYGGVLQGAFPIAFITISMFVLMVLQIMPAQGIESAYDQWGWRIPFLLGAALGFVFVAFRSKVPESDLWRSTPRVRHPLRELVRNPQRADFVQVFTLMTGLWFISISVVSVMPLLLLRDVGMTATMTTLTLLVAHLGVFAGKVTAGILGQRFGRRTVLIRGATLAGTVGLALYASLASLDAPSLAAGILVVLTHIMVVSIWGVATPYCNERFPTAIRASGFGVGYSASVIIPGLYALYMAGLSTLMPLRYTQLVLLAVGAGLVVFAAGRGPETSEVDLASQTGPLAVAAP
jgi:MFS family permease